MDVVNRFHALAFSGEIGPDLKANVVECCLASQVAQLERQLKELAGEATLARDEARKKGAEHGE